MDIGIVVLFMNSFGRKGYYQSQEFGMADAFARAGHNTDVYRCVTDEPHEERYECGECACYNVYYNKVFKFGTHALFNPSSFFRKKYDCIIAFSDTQLIVPALYRYCTDNGILFVPYVGVTESVAFNKKVKKTIMDSLFRATTLKTYLKCRHIFCKSRAVMSSLVNLGVRDESLVFSPVGINTGMLNTEYTYADRPAVRKELGYSDNEKIILFVGRMIDEKRPLDMFRILEGLDEDCSIIMIGDGPLASKVSAAAMEYGSRVRYLKKVRYDEMWKYYASADCFVNLWDREIFGMAIVEAVFYMLPAFLIRAPGPEVISEGMENVSLYDSVDELNDGIRKYLSGACADRESLERDREKLINDFSWTGFVNNLERIADVNSDKQEKDNGKI